jgi:succinate dehydrogenase / fumarate reductase membrane anchor subunit
VALIPLVVLFVWVIVSVQGSGYEATVATLGNPFVAIGMLIAIAVTVVHMKIGMQVIIEDYVHTELTKIVLFMLNSFFSYGVGFAAAFALLKIAFGS